ncbi:MAG: type II secretion system F family protein [Actinomycetes bacterium]
MTSATVGAVLGAALAVGCWLLLLVLRRRVDFSDRVLPFVRAADARRGVDAGVSGSRSGVFTGALQPDQRTSSAAAGGVRALRAIWSDESVSRRLVQAGRDPAVEAFRLTQLRWAGIGVAVVLACGIARAAAGKPISAVPWLMLCAVGALAAATIVDQCLSRVARMRTARIAEQLPAFAELLAFTVAAGLAPVSALNRVASRLGGDLATELRRCTDEIAQGRSLADALEDVAYRTRSASVQRFVDGIVVAVDRGTPIADVLRAQAMDARGAGHRALMESAGKREIYALVPVVFLILPVVVVVAVFPGFYGLAL